MVTVVRNDRSRTVVVQGRTVEAIRRGQTVVNDSRRTVAVATPPRTVQVGGVAIVGPEGPPGTAGVDAQFIPPIAFSWGDAPGDVWVPDVAGTLTHVRVVITVPFDGAAPTLKVGTLADDDEAMTVEQNDPATVGEYELTADTTLAAGEAVRLAIAPGFGASQGTGLLFLTFLPNAS